MKRFFQYSAGLCCVVLTIGLTIRINEAASAESQLSKLPHIEAKKHKDYVQKIPGKDVTFEMMAIPAGTFMMGSPEGEKGRDKDEGPLHPVKLKAFWIGKFEVTWDEYDLYWRQLPMQAKKPLKNPIDIKADAVSRPTRPYADETFGHGRKSFPVLGITYHSAMKYCEWLSIKTGKYYRLPTEAEWEWACRAGTTTAYSFGDDPEKLDDYGWYYENSDDTTQKVGSKKANPWGLYDMHGNVSEWCLDHYKADFYASLPKGMAALNPFVPPTKKRYPHVVRGGSWIESAADCRCAARARSDPSWLKRDPQSPQSIWWMTDADYVGFRVVCAVEEYDNLKGIKSQITPESPCD